MRRLTKASRKIVTLVVTATLVAFPATSALAESPVKLQNYTGTLDTSAGGLTPFTLAGSASHLGRFTAEGEVDLQPGVLPGTLSGEGVVVFESANGDSLAGIATFDFGPEANGRRTVRMHFSWRDSVAFSDGTLASSTGRFADRRPPGLVVIDIYNVILRLIYAR